MEIRAGIADLEKRAFTGNLTDREEEALIREKAKLMELKRQDPKMREEQGVLNVSSR